MTAGGIDDTLHDLGLYTKHGILKLQEIWNEIGVGEVEQVEKCVSVISSLRSVLDSLVIGERAWKDVLEAECLQLSECCNESNRVLGLPPLHPDTVDMPVLPKRDYFIARDVELKNMIDKMKLEIESLEERRTACITKLGLQPDHYPSIQSDNIHRILSLLQSQIKEFEEDMSRRTVRLNEQLTELCILVDSLEIDRSGLIEEGLLSEDDPDSLTLSDDAMNRRDDLISKYRNEVQDKKSLSTDLSEKLCRLHRLLYKDPLPDTADIRTSFSCPKPSSLTRLQEHLDELNKEKQGKLDAYVAGIKLEIDEFQKLCFQTRCQVSSSEDTNNTRDTSSDLKTSSTDTLDLPDILLDNLENKDTSNTDHSSRESLTRHALTRQDSVFSNQTKDDVDEINLIDDEDDDLTKSNHVLSKDINSSSDHTDDISKSDGVSLVYGVSNVDEVSNISSIDNIANLGSISRADSISRLEEELETWESFYKSNREMFEMIRKWKELNERFFELEAPSPDKYNNRGGALLQSQKEAAKISKEIPKIENKVVAEIEKMVGEEIRINGLHPEDYFIENRATTTLSRMNSVRRSRKKSDINNKNLNSPRTVQPSSEDRPRTRSVGKGGSLGRKKGSEVAPPTPEQRRNSVNKRSIRRRISKEAGLDKVGLK